ncbi:hypothetical protein SISNIDRAFT_454652 [Sistotremastrum niveocremeum HHB9708]|uniref:Uncharacterized protein n=2 Tax=Sistotremastraceae TaxID=3402574 RepID=A0A164UQW1_9AGAM|nr:hypothetical protein SISNIDRAFT_454652 [Sistotremastrum niveocremeum HHB9708]KZT43734.1 hypothetical protein SISSUDRAFT_1039609 [Sistotremastrum suecicum HHB10207 ss-3]
MSQPLAPNFEKFAAEGAGKAAYGSERAQQEAKADTAKVEGYLNQGNSVANQAASTFQDAAITAQEKGYDAAATTSDAANQFGNQAAAVTGQAVHEGQENVEAAKATGAGYLEQAKNLAGTALATAQGYVQAGQEAIAPKEGESTQSSIVNTLQSTASTALGYTKSALSTAQSTISNTAQSAYGAAQPHIDAATEAAAPHVQAAKDAIQPHLENAQATVQPHVEQARAAAQPHIDYAAQKVQEQLGSAKSAYGSESTPSGVAPTTADLESGPHTISQPYGGSAEDSRKIGENAV